MNIGKSLEALEADVQSGIFISYRRSDSAAIAGRIHDRLTQRLSGSIFMDVERLHAGTRFREDIDGTLAQSAAVIAVIGPDWWESVATGSKLGDAGDFVTYELAAALKHKVPIIPVLINGSAPPQRAKLPAELQGLADFHAVELRDSSFGRDIELIEEAVFRCLGTSPPTALERFMESLPISFGMRYSQPMRGYHAMLTLLLGSFSLFAPVLLWAIDEPADLELFTAPVAGFYTWAVGRNALRFRWLAWTGLVMSAVGLVGLMAVPANYRVGTPLPLPPPFLVQTSDIGADVVIGVDYQLSPGSAGPTDDWTLDLVLRKDSVKQALPSGWPRGEFLLQEPDLRLKATAAQWRKIETTLSRREPGLQYEATFTRFRANLGKFADPREWHGALVEARLSSPGYSCGSADRPKIFDRYGESGNEFALGPFARHYGTTEEVLSEMAGPDEQDSGKQIRPTGILISLSLVVAGQVVARAESLLASVCAYQVEVGTERYIAHFPVETTKTPLPTAR